MKKILVLAVALTLAFVGVASANVCTVKGVGSYEDTSSVIVNCKPDVRFVRHDVVKVDTDTCRVTNAGNNGHISAVLLSCGPTLLLKGDEVTIEMYY